MSKIRKLSTAMTHLLRPRFAFWFALLAVALAAASAVADDWPQWRGPNRDGVWRETGTLATFPKEGLTIRWRAPVGFGWSSPVVAQGRVYLTDAQLLAF